MDCRNALLEAGGDKEKALEILKKQNLFKAEKSKKRSTSQGLVETYLHSGGRVGAMVEMNCETDFVARTEEFKKLAHEIAMQIAAMDPQFISQEEVTPETDAEFETVCLLLQPYIRDPAVKIQDLINEAIAKTGENIRIKRFARFELGDE